MRLPVVSEQVTDSKEVMSCLCVRVCVCVKGGRWGERVDTMSVGENVCRIVSSVES